MKGASGISGIPWPGVSMQEQPVSFSVPLPARLNTSVSDVETFRVGVANPFANRCYFAYGGNACLSVFFSMRQTNQVSRFGLRESRFENPGVDLEKRPPYLPQDQRYGSDPYVDIPPWAPPRRAAVNMQIWTALIAMLLLKFLLLKSTWAWSLSTLAAFSRFNLLTYRDLWAWLNAPFEVPIVAGGSEQMALF